MQIPATDPLTFVQGSTLDITLSGIRDDEGNLIDFSDYTASFVARRNPRSESAMLSLNESGDDDNGITLGVGWIRLYSEATDTVTNSGVFQLTVTDPNGKTDTYWHGELKLLQQVV